MRLLILLLLTNTHILGQTKIDGVGKLKIGAHVRLIEEIAKETGAKIKDSKNVMDYDAMEAVNKKPDNIYFIFKSNNEGDLSDFNCKLNSRVKVYFMNYYEVSGVELNKLYLFFYSDTLYSIECNGSNEITEAITLKYGEPKLAVTKKKVKCKSRLIGEFEEEQVEYSSTWNNALNNIIVNSTTGTYYDTKCQKNLYSFFSISNKKLKTSVENKEKILQSELERKNKELKKKELSNF